MLKSIVHRNESKKDEKCAVRWGSAVAVFLLMMTLGLNVTPAYSQYSCTPSAGVAIWVNSGSGDWSVAGNWNPSTGAPNNANTSVCILNATATTVTLNTFQFAAMDNLTINAADTLNVSGLEVGLNVYGNSILNAGNINFFGGNDLSSGLAIGNSATLSGGGTVTLSTAPGGGDAYIIAVSHTTDTLTNVDNTIQGNGVVGAGAGTGAMTLVNESNGTIDATTANGQIATLTLNGSGITNTGLLEATTGTLQIQTAVANGGGNITADGGTVAFLSGSSVTGGTLNVLNGGTLETAVANETLLDGSTGAGAVTINGTYTNVNSTTVLNGTITNNGTIQVTGGAFSRGILALGSAAAATTATVTLQGGGTVTLATAPGGIAIIEQAGNAGATLVNVDNTIQGNGAMGNAPLSGNISVVNESLGTIDATTASGQINSLTLNVAGVTNEGLMEATNSGVLVINAPVNNAGGNITANGGSVVLDNSITGGTLNTLNGGTMGTLAGANAGANLIGVTISAGSTYATANDNVTGLQETITNNGTILVNGGGALGIGSSTTPNVTLQGGGTVTLSTLSGGFDALVAGAFQVSGATLTNVDNTIQGNGIIGDGLALVNQTKGVVDATTVHGQINTLTLAGGGVITNQGLLEATSGTLVINTTVNNAGGNITANGGTVEVDSATIQGGTLNTLNGGTMETVVISSLDGSTASGAVTISSGSTYTASNSAITHLKGTITNNGAIQLNGGGGTNGFLLIDNNVTLQGGGTVTLATAAGGGFAIIEQNVAGLKLTNVNDTIQGNGVIGNNGLALVNDGIIDATTAHGQINTLTLNGFGPVTNNGTLEATAGATLHLTGGGTFNNFSGSTLTGGTYDANGTIQIDQLGFAGGEIVTNNATIILDGSNSGAAAILDSARKNALSALATNQGSFTIENGGNASFTTGGNLQNSGSVNVAAGTTLTTGTGGASNYTQSGGVTTVNGTLKSAVVAINGGLLNGVGTVAGAVTIGPGGMVQAGDAPGTINISGSLAINGALNEEIDSAASFDLLNIAGTPGSLTLGSGSALDILLAPGYDPAAGTSFTIASASGGLSGVFGSIVNGTFNNGTEDWEVAYNGNNVVLTAGNVSTPPTTVTATWSAASGSWAAASEWTCTPGPPTCDPNNGTPANTNYDAVLNSPGNTMTLSTAGTTAINSLALTAGTLDIASGATLTLVNQANGITDIPNGAGLSIEGSFTAGSNNGLAGLTSVEGFLTLDNGQATGVTPGSGMLTNSGTVNVQQSSTLAITGALTNSGSINTGNGAGDTGNNTVNVSGLLTNNGTITLAGTGDSLSADLTNAGAINLKGNKETLTDKGDFNNNKGGSLSLTAASNEVDVAGNFNNNAGASVTMSGTKGSLVAAIAFINGGTVTLDGVGDVLGAASFTNTGSVSIGQGEFGGPTETVSVGAAGVYSQTAAGASTTVDGRMLAGSVNIKAGSLLGTGTIDAGNNGTVNNSGGKVEPGSPAGNPGTLTIANGNYTQGAGGTLTIDLAGIAPGQFSVLNVSGNASLDGTVDFTAVGAFKPESGNTFTFLFFGTKSGNFANMDFTNWACPANNTCTDVFGPASLSLEITPVNVSPTPEPSAWLMLGTALAIAAFLELRKVVSAS